MILVYVDDCLIMGTLVTIINETIGQIESRFKIKTLGYPQKFLGIQVARKLNGGLILYQTDNVIKVLRNYRMEEALAQPTPMVLLGNHKSLKNISLECQFPYKQAIGELLYLANTMQLDIAYAVNYAARFQAAPEDIHYTLVKRILRYLKGNPTLGINNNTNSNIILYPRCK